MNWEPQGAREEVRGQAEGYGAQGGSTVAQESSGVTVAILAFAMSDPG